MDLDKALEILSQTVSEASVGALARAAENNLPKRRKAAADAIKGYKKSRNDYNTYAEKHPEDEEALYKKMEADDEVAAKAYQKALDAEDIKDLKLPKNSKVSANKLFKAAHKVEKGREDKIDTSSPKAFNRTFKRMSRVHDITANDPVKSRTNEALSLVEEMLSLANSIFEETPQTPETEGVPPSNNKIKQTKKSKETNKPTEVVSVADELFPYEGNAKEQMNQKILAKINDMIEGTATLEDLLQLVRKNTKKPVAVKEGFDRAEAVLEEIINEVSNKKKQEKLDLANHLEYVAHKKAKDYSLNKGKVYGPTGEQEEKLWHLFSKAYERRDKLEKAIKKHDKAKEEGKIKPANGKKYQD